MIALALGMVYLDVLFNAWNRDFCNALDPVSEAALVSIAHHEAVARYHEIRWQFVHEPQALNKLVHATEAPRYTIRASQLPTP